MITHDDINHDYNQYSSGFDGQRFPFDTVFTCLGNFCKYPSKYGEFCENDENCLGDGTCVNSVCDQPVTREVTITDSNFDNSENLIFNYQS